MQQTKASKLSFDPRPQMGLIFAEGFYRWLKHFSADKERLGRAMAHIFNLEHFYVSHQGEEITSIAALTDGRHIPVKLDKGTLTKELGFFRGRLAYKMLGKFFVEHKYPFDIKGNTGAVEFVVAATAFRGKGTTYALIEHMMGENKREDYILEVANDNTAAIKLYEKLGFHEFKRISAPSGSGFEHYIYMHCAPDENVRTEFYNKPLG